MLQDPAAQPEPPRTPVPSRWLFAGGCALSGVAGFVNAACLLTSAQTVSHLTGSVSSVAVDLVIPGRQAQAWPFVLVLVCFVAGAAACGVIVGGQSLAPGRRYGVAMVVESACLALGAAMIERNAWVGFGAMAFAMGLQNAMAAMYRGLIIRTTHVTGIATDLGVLLGHLARREPVEHWRLVLLITLALGFAVGGVTGAVGHLWLGPDCLWLPAASTFVAGTVYFFWRSIKARSFWREFRIPGH